MGFRHHGSSTGGAQRRSGDGSSAARSAESRPCSVPGPIARASDRRARCRHIRPVRPHQPHRHRSRGARSDAGAGCCSRLASLARAVSARFARSTSPGGSAPGWPQLPRLVDRRRGAPWRRRVSVPGRIARASDRRARCRHMRPVRPHQPDRHRFRGARSDAGACRRSRLASLARAVSARFARSTSPRGSPPGRSRSRDRRPVSRRTGPGVPGRARPRRSRRAPGRRGSRSRGA